MSKLHELLAAEPDRVKVAKEILTETVGVFGKKPERFHGQSKVYKPFDENAMDSFAESKEIDETVPGKLRYMLQSFGKAIDIGASKDRTNQDACADLVVNGKVLAEKLPAVTLLALEKHLAMIIAVLRTIPTLAPGRKWEKDPDAGEHIYRDANPEEEFRTKRVTKSNIVVQPTEFHPAQVDRWEEDERVGKYITTKWSGMISPQEKHEILERAGDLLEAAKMGRQRANCQEVTQIHLSEALTDYLLKG